MTDTWHLDDLPYELLLIIFDYCDVLDLMRLSEVCKRFHEIVQTDKVWIKKSKTLLVTNEMSKRFRRRCNPILPPCIKLCISYNWNGGRYKKETLFSHKLKLMPWLQLTNDTLWWSGAHHLRSFARTKQSKIEPRHINNYYNRKQNGQDISKFVLWDKFVISGHRNGDIKYWMETRTQGVNYVFPIKEVRAQCCDINAIDATSQNIVSGTNCGEIQIRRNALSDESVEERVININNIKDKILSLAIDPTRTKTAVGTTAFTHITSLHMIDMDCYTVCNPIRHRWTHGAGILDMLWEDPHTLLTCGYDTYVRKWDIRTGTNVSSWADPTDATVYCISSDYRYSIVTGTQYNSLAVLWDQRKNDFVQLYYINSQTTCQSSPIYSLQFDSSHLYCATDHYIIQLDFSDHLCQKLDYKNYFPVRTW